MCAMGMFFICKKNSFFIIVKNIATRNDGEMLG